MVIIDAGPLVALFDDSEPTHKACDEAIKSIKSPPATTWPVLTEAFYFLRNWRKGQVELFDFIISGGLVVYEIPQTAHPRMRELMGKHAEYPMDLADASLVVISELHRIRKVFTLDRRDFSRCRPRHCTHFTIIP